MKCPRCGMNLVEIDCKSIKVDRCSPCEGVWLDAGELAQIVKLEKGALDKLFSVFSNIVAGPQRCLTACAAFGTIES